MTEKYNDLLIQNNDLVLDAARVPLNIDGRASIAQDIVHLIRDSERLKQIVAERSRLTRRDQLRQIELLMEADTRLVPGTCRIDDEGAGRFLVTATTVDYGELSLGVSVD